jgi:hypothetical protein
VIENGPHLTISIKKRPTLLLFLGLLLIMVGALSAAGRAQPVAALSGMVVESKPCSVTPTSIPMGGTVNATGTVTNGTSSTVTLSEVILAGRAPGGTNSGGPFHDFMPKVTNVRLRPGGSFTINTSETIGSGSPFGTWRCYLTFSLPVGNYHDGANFNFTVGTSTCRVSGATGATATTIFTPTVTPNDGLDDYAGIQNQINAAGAAGGGIVPLPAGELDLTNHLQMRSGVKLSGQGNAGSSTPTRLKAISGFLSSTGPQGGYPVITTNGASNVTIANLIADQNGGSLFQRSHRLEAYLVDLRNSTNALVDSISTRNPSTYSIAAVGSNHFCIRGSDTQVGTNGVYDQLDGIHVLDSSFGDVVNNFADQRFNDSKDGDDALVAHTINGTTTTSATSGTGPTLALGGTACN